MATRTSNYNLSKPEQTDTQASLVSAYRDNMDIIDKQMGNKNIAEDYDNTQTYAVGRYVIYDGDLYKCTTAVTTAEDFDSTKWTQTVASDEFGSGGGGSGGHVIIDENDTEVAQEPNMQFTGKVEVTDDSINEKTVVEVLPEVVEVTLAEYIALGDMVNTDGKLYCITDLNNSDVQGYPPLIYSTDEREVGVWIDGKPLYQITFELSTSVTISNSSWQSIGVSPANGEKIINCWGMTEDYSCAPFLGWMDGTTLKVQTARSGSGSYSIKWVTVQYTKTTDTAGSGIWNGQGGYAHHYSTSEKVIGTWIDGKPLYEKTFTGLSLTCQNANEWYNTGIAYGDIKSIVSGNIIDQYGQCVSGTVGYVTISNVKYLGVYLLNTGRVVVNITVQYTKTTD